ncbi:hypothetical protein GCM10010177_35600 [Actinomadura citrea]|nr:hypothetical protein GCM10010177_35600 [Actinomadura citrea]
MPCRLPVISPARCSTWACALAVDMEVPVRRASSLVVQAAAMQRGSLALVEPSRSGSAPSGPRARSRRGAGKIRTAAARGRPARRVWAADDLAGVPPERHVGVRAVGTRVEPALRAGGARLGQSVMMWSASVDLLFRLLRAG